MTREKPILFSAPMVRAILDGAKTQTRRLAPDFAQAPVEYGDGWYEVVRPPGHGGDWARPFKPQPHAVGDTLWAKETWRVGGLRDPVMPRYEDRGDVARSDGLIAVDYAASPELVRTPWCAPPGPVFQKLRDQTLERARKLGVSSWGHGESPDRWRPSIYMPRWASRLTLRVTDVRVERLGNISEADARAEGAMHWWRTVDGDPALNPRYVWEHLWEHVHGDGAWERDHKRWVWVYTFEVA